MPVTNLAVCGLHLRGQALNHQLTDLGASFVEECRSSPNYKLFALPANKNGIAKPAMIFAKEGGAAIALEIWQMQVEMLGSFVLKVPRPLAIGRIILADGKECPGFIAEGFVAEDSECVEITRFGGWLNYINADT